MRDAATGAVLGAAEWETVRGAEEIETRKEEEEDKEKEKKMEEVEGVNHAALNAFRRAQAECQKEMMQGKLHLYLHVLVVDPEYQRRGVGSAAMASGLQRADELGLPVCLEASKYGRGLYERCGFRVVKPVPFDPRELGHTEAGEHCCMLREAVVA